uniref:TPPII domain-containing protein n=1 Tax=Gongylonema pulchrum TaxID=637853 RepID=A0A183DV00_9BILA
LLKHHSSISPLLTHFEIKVSSASARGIYLREHYQSCRASTYAIGVQPFFKPESDNDAKIEFVKHLVLTCDAPYVKCAKQFTLMHQEREFTIYLNPVGLEAGVAHFTEICAYDSSNISFGPLFRIPITVIVPMVLDDNSQYMITRKLKCKPACSERLFVHTVTLDPSAEEQYAIKLQSARTMELCLTKWWSNLGEAVLEAELVFHVQKASEANFELPGITDYLYESAFDDVHIMVFSTTKQYFGSSAAYPDRYVLKLEKGEYRARVQIRHEDATLLEKYRETILILKLKLATPISLDCFQNYESAVKGDGKKFGTKTLKPGEIATVYIGQFPDDKIMKASFSSHRFIETVVLPISFVFIFARNLFIEGAVKGDGKKFGTKTLKPGEIATVYIGQFPDDKLPKSGSAGCYLVGAFCLADMELSRSHVQYPVTYTFPEWPRKLTKEIPAVTLGKKKEDCAPDSIEAMNGKDFFAIQELPFFQFDDSVKSDK